MYTKDIKKENSAFGDEFVVVMSWRKLNKKFKEQV
jgi:hypothetical protein